MIGLYVFKLRNRTISSELRLFQVKSEKLTIMVNKMLIFLLFNLYLYLIMLA